MNKKLIAVAVASVVAAPAAFAGNDTTMYGKAHVSIQSNDMGAADNYTVNSNASRWGVKGSEDLGNGLKAIFQYELQYDVSDGGGFGGANRNSFVGLAGDWGTFLAGRHDTPAKVAFYAAGNDHIGDSIMDLNRGGGRAFGFTEVRASNAIAYISPSFSGFTVAAAIVPGEMGGVTASSAANNLADAYSLAAMYSGNGFKASLGYEVFGSDLFGAAAADQEMLQAGASYTMGDFTVGANWEDLEDIGGVAGADRTTWGLSGKVNFGNNYVAANWINSDPSVGGDSDRFGIGVGHKFSKRSQVYAAYVATDNAAPAADWDQFALGMIHTF